MCEGLGYTDFNTYLAIPNFITYLQYQALSGCPPHAAAPVPQITQFQ